LGGDSEDKNVSGGDFFDQIEEATSQASEKTSDAFRSSDLRLKKDEEKVESLLFSDRTEQITRDVDHAQSPTEDDQDFERTLYESDSLSKELYQTEDKPGDSEFSATREEPIEALPSVDVFHQEAEKKEAVAPALPSDLQDLFSNLDEEISTSSPNRREDVADLFEAKAIRVSHAEMSVAAHKGRGSFLKWGVGLAFLLLLGGTFFLLQSEDGLLGFRWQDFARGSSTPEVSAELRETFRQIVKTSSEARFKDDPKEIENQVQALENALIQDPKNLELAEELLEASAVLLSWLGSSSEVSLKYDLAWSAINEIEREGRESPSFDRKIRARAWYGLALGNFQSSIYDLEKITSGDSVEGAQNQSLLGELHFLTGNSTASLEVLDKLTLKNRRARFYQALAKSDESALQALSAEGYMPAQVELLWRQNDSSPRARIEQAISLVETIGRYPKWSARVWDKLGSLYWEQGEILKAIDSWNSVVSIRPQNHEIWKKLSHAYEREGLWQESIKALQEVIRHDPMNQEAILKLSRLHRSQNQVLEALSVLERGIKSDSNVAEFYFEMGLAQMMILQEGPAKESFEKALSINSQFAPATLGLARMAAQRGDLEAAATLFSGVDSKSAYHSEALLGLGNLSIRKRNSKDAEKLFREAIKANSKNELAYLGLTERLLRAERDQEASDLARAALRELPDSPLAHMAQAKVLSFQNKHTEALQQVESFVKANGEIPPFSWAHLNLLIEAKELPQAKSILENLRGRFQEDAQWSYLFSKWNWSARNASTEGNLNFLDSAWRSIRAALNSHPQREEFLELQVQIALALNDSSQTLDLSASLLNLYPQNPIGLEVRGDVLASSGRYEEALRSYERALSFTRFKNELYRKLADLHQNQGNLKIARGYLESLVKSNPRDAKAFLDLGRVYSEEGQMTKALRAFQRTTELEPKSPEAFYFLGFIQKSRGEHRNAIKSFERFLELKPAGIEAATIQDEIYFLRASPSSN